MQVIHKNKIKQNAYNTSEYLGTIRLTFDASHLGNSKWTEGVWEDSPRDILP